MIRQNLLNDKLETACKLRSNINIPTWIQLSSLVRPNLESPSTCDKEQHSASTNELQDIAHPVVIFEGLCKKLKQLELPWLPKQIHAKDMPVNPKDCAHESQETPCDVPVMSDEVCTYSYMIFAESFCCWNISQVCEGALNLLFESCPCILGFLDALGCGCSLMFLCVCICTSIEGDALNTHTHI